MGAEAEQFQIETSDFLRKGLTLWRRDRSLPPTDGRTVVLPFELRLPEDAPPSFQFESYMNNAYIRYAVEVTAVRTGTFAVDRTVKTPLVVLQPDPIGSSIRAQLKLGWQETWGRLKVESDMRKYPWGDYAHAKLEVRSLVRVTFARDQLGAEAFAAESSCSSRTWTRSLSSQTSRTPSWSRRRARP